MLQRSFGILTVIIAVFLLGTLQFISGQTSEQARPEAHVDPQLYMANVTFEPLGPGDLVYIQVADCPELTRSYRVSAQGDLKLPLLKDPIKAAGVKPGDLESTVAEAIKADRILVQPTVSVSVLEYRSRPVNVVGAVKHSVSFQAMGDVKLLDAIAKADGFAADAGPEVLVGRISESDTSTDQIKHIPIKELLAGTDPALNISLHGGEEIRIPTASKLYITGNVKNPGAFPLNETGSSTVLKALALCQGALPYSEKIAYIYRTEPGKKDRTEIPIPLWDIVHRKAPDMPLEANDVLYVQDNSRKRMTASVLDRITGFGTTSAQALAWRY